MGDQSTLVFAMSGEGAINVQYSDTLENSAMTLDTNPSNPLPLVTESSRRALQGLAGNTNATATGSEAVIRIVAVVVTAGTLLEAMP